MESCFLMQGLLCVRQYFKDGNAAEKALAEKIDELWRAMEFDWYTRGGREVLYWHWSPNYGWEMDFPLEGYNECLIAYILAAASPTHSIPADCYHKGWARSGAIRTTAAPYGYNLELKHNGAEATGGPLFWAHYSWIGLDPRRLADAAVQMAVAILRGEQPQVNDTTTYDNGVRVVPSYLLKSQIITKDDVRTALIDTGYVTEEELR